MGLPSTRANENQCRPRESGDPLSVGRKMDSRFRGNDESGRDFQGEIRRGVCPERQSEILRSAQNDKRRAQDDSEGLRMTAKGSE